MLDHQPDVTPGALPYGYVAIIIAAVVFLSGIIQRLWRRSNQKQDALIASLRKEFDDEQARCEQLRSELSSAKQGAAAARERHAREKADIIARENEMLKSMNEDLRKMIQLGERGIDGHA